MKRTLSALLALFLASAANAAIIQSGATSDNLTVDATSKAARVSLYDTRGNATGLKTSYSAASIRFVCASGTGVCASLYGSATKTIRVQRVIINGAVATAAVYTDPIITLRTVAASGGTATTLTQVPKDQNSAAGTATLVKTYTAAPTAGTGGGVIASAFAFMPLLGTAAMTSCPTVWDWTGQSMNEAPVLRGTAQGIEVSFGTSNANATTMTVQFEWTEE